MSMEHNLMRYVCHAGLQGIHHWTSKLVDVGRYPWWCKVMIQFLIRRGMFYPRLGNGYNRYALMWM